MTDFIQTLKDRTQAMWLTRPDDVSRMVGRNYNTGKEFSCWAYCWGYLSNLSNLFYMEYGIAKAEQGDLETHKLIAASTCRAYIGSFEASGHMHDLTATLAEAADAFDAATSFEEFAKLCRYLQRYLLQLSFWVDMELPWAEVCEFVDKRWHETGNAIVE